MKKDVKICNTKFKYPKSESVLNEKNAENFHCKLLEYFRKCDEECQYEVSKQSCYFLPSNRHLQQSATQDGRPACNFYTTIIDLIPVDALFFLM